MSVFNHKKSADEIVRNSLVIESIKMVKEILPKFFLFENVPAFMDTECLLNDNERCSIGDAISRSLSDDYLFYADKINFKNYGSNSSRTRTIVIGVRRDLCNHISPIELFPDREPEQTLIETIGDLRRLSQMGEIDANDIFHSFRPYPEYMRAWIENLDEGESAFENSDPLRIPYKIGKDGKQIENANKTGDKYKRQTWDKVAPFSLPVFGHRRGRRFAPKQKLNRIGIVHAVILLHEIHRRAAAQFVLVVVFIAAQGDMASDPYMLTARFFDVLALAFEESDEVGLFGRQFLLVGKMNVFCSHDAHLLSDNV